MGGGAGYIGENSVPSFKFCCESKTFLTKIKSIKKISSRRVRKTNKKFLKSRHLRVPSIFWQGEKFAQ